MKTKTSITYKLGISFYAIIITVIFYGCSQKLDNPKYKVGDIVYMKPDSTKAIIIDDDVIGGKYEIQYSAVENIWIRQYCKEYEIYGMECNIK